MSFIILKWRENKFFVPSFLLLILFIQCIYFAWDNGQTVDETFYNGSGYRMVRYNDYQVRTEHPPLMTQLGALPLLLFQPAYPIDDPIYVPNTEQGIDNSRMGSRFLYEMGNNARLILFLERIPVILVTILLGWFLFSWSYELFGLRGATVSLILYSFSPNIIAHGSLYTTDMGVTAFFMFALYAFKKFSDSPSVKKGFTLGLVCGLAMLTKMSALILFPTLLLLFVLLFLFNDKGVDWNRYLQGNRALDRSLTLLGVLIFLLTTTQKYLFVWAGPLCLLALRLTLLPFVKRKYGKFFVLFRAIYWSGWVACFAFVGLLLQSRGPFAAVAAASYVSSVMAFSILLGQHFTNAKLHYLCKIFCLIWLISLVVIIFGFTNFIESIRELDPFGLYMSAFKISAAHVMGNHRVCVDGSFVRCDWRYFLGAMLVKTPVAVLALFVVGLIGILRSMLVNTDKLCVTLPFFIFLFFASFVSQINIGIRHILPVYPFMFLIAGSVPATIAEFRPQILATSIYVVLFMALFLLVLRSVRLLPHHISYFTEWVGSAEDGARLLADSNVAWGQDNRRLAELVRKLELSSIKVAGSTLNASELTYYKVPWSYMGGNDFAHPKPGYYAMDLQLYTSLQRQANSWFAAKRPDYQAGHTIYVFKVAKPLRI